MRRILVSFGMLCGLTGMMLQAQQSPGGAPPAPYPAQVTAVSTDAASPWLIVTRVHSKTDPASWPSIRFTVAGTDKNLQEALKQLHPGDLVAVTASGTTLQNVEIRKVSVTFLRSLITLAVVALALWALTWLLTKKGALLGRFLVGRDNRYSKSKFQIAIWFATVMATYIGILCLRWWAGVPSLVGGVDIPQNLLLLSGISALSFGTAKGITQRKENNPAAADKTTAANPSFPSDLVSDDSGQPDLGDFQMVMITLIAVGVYLTQVFSFLHLLELKAQVSMPDVDATLLGIFGISHGAYLMKKAVSGDDGVQATDQPRTRDLTAGVAPKAPAPVPAGGPPGPV